jgi:hypothetical protein
MSKTTIPTGGITADAINGTLIADDAINSEHYTDGSIDTAHIGDSQVTLAKTTGVGGDLSFGGDTFGADKTIGSNDNYALKFETNGTERLELTNDGRGLSQFTAKAWANINGNTFGERDSHNFSSFTDNGTGDYTFTFANSMANTNYAVVSTAANGTSHGDFQGVDAIVNATGNVRIYTCYVSATNSGSSAHNVLNLHIAVFGD